MPPRRFGPRQRCSERPPARLRALRSPRIEHSSSAAWTPYFRLSYSPLELCSIRYETNERIIHCLSVVVKASEIAQTAIGSTPGRRVGLPKVLLPELPRAAARGHIAFLL